MTGSNAEQRPDCTDHTGEVHSFSSANASNKIPSSGLVEGLTQSKTGNEPVLSETSGSNGGSDMLRRFCYTLLIVCGLAVSVQAADKAKKDIVDTAVGAGSFKTLVTAVKAADLVETLKGKGPFTVFAPTDAAFKKLPKGTLESLLKLL